MKSVITPTNHFKFKDFDEERELTFSILFRLLPLPKVPMWDNFSLFFLAKTFNIFVEMEVKSSINFSSSDFRFIDIYLCIDISHKQYFIAISIVCQ